MEDPDPLHADFPDGRTFLVILGLFVLGLRRDLMRSEPLTAALMLLIFAITAFGMLCVVRVVWFVAIRRVWLMLPPENRSEGMRRLSIFSVIVGGGLAMLVLVWVESSWPSDDGLLGAFLAGGLSSFALVHGTTWVLQGFKDRKVILSDETEGPHNSNS